MGGGLVGVCVADPFEEEYYAVYGAVADAIVVVLERPDVLSWVVEAMHIYIYMEEPKLSHALTVGIYLNERIVSGSNETNSSNWTSLTPRFSISDVKTP